MAKLYTKKMAEIDKKNAKRKQTGTRNVSPGREAWKRLRRNRTALLGMGIIIVLLFVAVFADLLAPYDYAAQDYNVTSQTPSWAHPFGTDNVGRDILSRCIIGTRISLPIGMACVVSALLLGGSLGTVAAYFGGRADSIIMRVMDVFQAIPGTLMAISIIAALGNGMSRLILAITIAMTPVTSRICRAAIFTVKNEEYIEASRAIGAGGGRIMLRHMIPNAVGPIIIAAVNMVSASILSVSTLSYLGLGISPPTPEWGALLSYGKEYIQSYPHMVVFPGLMIMITLFAFNLFGDGLRDALDPRLK